MAQPVLVRAYTNRKSSEDRTPGKIGHPEALPPISAYSFAAILREVDGDQGFQTAIDGIAEICAKNRLSLAEEYASHLPPVGEITTATSSTVRPQLHRPGMRRALTSVPEASSGSSEGSRKSASRKSGIFGFRKQQKPESKAMKRMRIGSMGRMVPVGPTTAMAVDVLLPPPRTRSSSESTVTGLNPARPASQQRASSAAASSLQRLLGLT